LSDFLRMSRHTRPAKLPEAANFMDNLGMLDLHFINIHWGIP